MKNTRFGIVTQIANGVAAAFITIAYGGVVIFRLIEEFNPFALQGSLKDLMPSLI
jgi:hypothetical protein